MSRSPDTLRILLVQARNTPDMLVQEQECFQERCRLAAERFVPVNVVTDALHPGLLDGVDAFMIGGSGEYSVAKDYPWMEALLGLVRLAYDRRLPTFGSCWGHQLIARALGGTVIYDGARAELGCREVTLTEAGRRDRLFRDFPHRFLANMGHQDRVVALPPEGVELARNASQPYQAFRIEGRPMYGTQFHSELDARRERERLLKYRAHYADEIGGDDAFQAILDTLLDTSEVDHLLHDFVAKFVIAPESSPT